MSHLTPHECRVLGVLVEKAQTTPTQYPLTLNGVIAGCSQKSNRHPVFELAEEQVMTALDSLRAKQLVREVMLSGSRVEKYRHVARETMDVSTSELVILAELLLRGPQTVGELRARASRMHPLESMEIVSNVLNHLAQRPEPLVKSIPPAPGSRAGRWVQLLCPELHPLDAAPSAEPPVSTGASGGEPITDRIDRLEAEVRSLRAAVSRLESVLQP